MKIRSVCRRRVVTIDRDGTLAEAARLMREHHVGALIVTAPGPQGTQVAGIVTDRDLVVDVLASGLDARGVGIGDLANDRVVAIAEDEDVSQAIAAMQANGVRRLAVVDAEQHLTGIVSLDDLLLACASDLAGLAAVIRSGAAREAAETSADVPPPSPPLRVPAVGTAGWGSAKPA